MVHAINQAAFGRPDEADLVDHLRAEGVALVSLVAELEKRLVGHLLFSRVWIDTTGTSIPAVALAPMAVLPGYQRHGIGGRMIQLGLNLLRQRDEQIVIVLGHPDYYPRFGFGRARQFGLKDVYGAPDEAFMAMELVEGALSPCAGLVHYQPEFDRFV